MARQLTARGRLPKISPQEGSMLRYVSREDKTCSYRIVRVLVDDLISNVLEQCDKSETITAKHTGKSVSEKLLQKWTNEFHWLVVEGKGLEMKFKCNVCMKHKINSIWAKEGSTNIQKDSMSRHSNSFEHQAAEKMLLASTQDFCESSPDSDSEAVLIDTDDMKLFRTVFFAAKEEMPSVKINSLLELQVLNGSFLKYKNISWDTISDIQGCISNIIQRDLVSEVNESGVYALMLDESTDLTVHKHLSICVRYVKTGEPVTKFLANLPLPDGKAHTIVNETINCLTKLGLESSKIVSLATDGAATMLGKKTGVGVQMKSKHAPYLVQTHCMAHRLNLAVSDSIKKDKTLEKFREKFNALYVFMSNSSLRVEKLKNIQALLAEPDLTIKEPHGIRWLGLKKAVEAVYESYNSVLATLSSFAESCSVSKGLLKYFLNYKTVLLVAFMLDVHEIVGVLSQQLQKQNIVFSEIQPLLDGTLGQLQFLESNDGKALKAIRSSIEIRNQDSNKVAILEGEKLSKYDEQIENEMMTLRKQYVTRLQKNIKSRLRKEDSDVFTQISFLLEPTTVETAESKDCENALEFVGCLYGEEKQITTVYGNLTDGCCQESKKVDKLLDKEKLIQEWPRVKGMISGSYKGFSVSKFCKRVLRLHQEILEFRKLCKIALCFAITSVECERSFSTQNRLKNKYRSSLKNENLDILISIAMCKVDVQNFNPSKAVKLWLRKKKRRKGRLSKEYQPRQKKNLCQ